MYFQDSGKEEEGDEDGKQIEIAEDEREPLVKKDKPKQYVEPQEKDTSDLGPIMKPMSAAWKKLQTVVKFRIRVNQVYKSIMMLNREKLDRKQEHSEKNFSDLTLWDKIDTITEFPFEWIRKLTILPCEEEEYDNYLVIIWPFIGIPVGTMIITLQLPTTWPWLYIIGPIAIIWAGLWGYFVKKRKVAPEKTFIIIAFLGMVWGFIWTYWVSGVLIDLLTFVGVITKLSSTYLALTIIAVGNALPDALITISFAKQGKAMLGITGGYAG